MTPQSVEHFGTIRSMLIDALALGRHAKVTSDVFNDFPADENSAPDLVLLREDAVPLTDGRTFVLDLNELPTPEPETGS